MTDKQNKLPQESKAQLNRKGNKPLMEKKRRARINHYLNQLADLLCKSQKKSNTQHSKLEKADILEMTVKHVKYLQNQLNLQSMDADSTLRSKYRIGYEKCVDEVNRYLGSVQTIDDEVRDRITDHISSRRIHMTADSLQPLSRVENIENENMAENIFQKPEAMEQDLPNLLPSKLSSPNAYPMKALQVNIPNSLPLSGMALPMLTSRTDSILSPQTATVSLCDNFSNSDLLKQSENYRVRSKVVTPTSVENALNSSGAKVTIDIPQNRGQYIQQTKQTVAVEPFTTVQSRIHITPTEIGKPSSPKTDMDKSTTSVPEPMLVKFSPSSVAGSFQIIPGAVYGGQPVALYLAPTSTLPTTTRYMTSSATNTSSTMTTAKSTTSKTLSFQMPHVVTAVVSPPTLELSSPPAAMPAPSSVAGSPAFGHFSPSFPFTASFSTSSYNSSIFTSTSGHSLSPVSFAQQIETGNASPDFRSNSSCSSEGEMGIWRPW